MAANVHSFAVGGAILLRRPWRRMMNDDTKDKFLFKSLIDKWQPEQKLNRTIGDDRRLRRPPLPQNCLLAVVLRRIGKNFSLVI